MHDYCIWNVYKDVHFVFFAFGIHCLANLSYMVLLNQRKDILLFCIDEI